MENTYSLSDVAAVTRGNDGFGWGADGMGFFWILPCSCCLVCLAAVSGAIVARMESLSLRLACATP